ncbi:MAG TPA: hypothetical protein VGQ30_13375 [Gemmatimonadaceae bacterium]|nr:hypothetical protein [Gemmatimonadaceae bacterium]
MRRMSVAVIAAAVGIAAALPLMAAAQDIVKPPPAPKPDAAAAQPDTELVRRLRGLLTSKNKVADYQSFVYAAARLYAKVGDPSASNIVEASRLAAYKFPRDSVALAALDRALAGHSFQTESLPPPKKP